MREFLDEGRCRFPSGQEARRWSGIHQRATDARAAGRMHLALPLLGIEYGEREFRAAYDFARAYFASACSAAAARGAPPRVLLNLMFPLL